MTIDIDKKEQYQCLSSLLSHLNYLIFVPKISFSPLSTLAKSNHIITHHTTHLY